MSKQRKLVHASHIISRNFYALRNRFCLACIFGLSLSEIERDKGVSMLTRLKNIVNNECFESV